MNKENRNKLLILAGIGTTAAVLTSCTPGNYNFTLEVKGANPPATTPVSGERAVGATPTIIVGATGSQRFSPDVPSAPVSKPTEQVAQPTKVPTEKVAPTVVKAEPTKVPVAPTVAATAVKAEAPKTVEGSTDGELLHLIPKFPELVKDDPETKFVPNRVPMWFDTRDSNNPLNELRNKVNAYSNSKGWGDITAKLGEWHYPLPVNGKGETTSDTWAYAENIIEARNLSVYVKPNVTGQTWFRLPKGVDNGHMTVAYAVNQNYEGDKTFNNPDIAPAVTVKCPNNPGQSITVRVLDIYKDGRVFARNDGYIGLPKTDTDNIMVRLNRDAITLIDFAVVDQTSNQREGMIELGSDSWAGGFYNPNLNRSIVQDVAKQLK